MLLTIHNLPFHFTYARIKSLLQEKCGLTSIILDKLQSEGKTKKVTVGVADEEDGAVLVRKINGLYLDGEHLHVRDVGKSRTSEQPYHSSINQNRDLNNQAFMYDGQNAQLNMFQNQPQIDQELYKKQQSYIESNAMNQQVPHAVDPNAGLYFNVDPNYYMGYNYNAQQPNNIPGVQTAPAMQDMSFSYSNSGNPSGFQEPAIQNSGSSQRSRDRLGPHSSTQGTQSTFGNKRSHPSRHDTSNQRNDDNFTLPSQRFFNENEHTVTIANSYDNNSLSIGNQIFGEHCTSNLVEPPSYRNEPVSKRMRGCNSQQFDDQEFNNYEPTNSAQHVSGNGGEYYGNYINRVSQNSTRGEFEKKRQRSRNRNKKGQFDQIASRWNESPSAADPRSNYRRPEVSNATTAVKNNAVFKPQQKFDTRIPGLKYGSGETLSDADKLRAAKNKDLTNRGQATAEIAKTLMKYSTVVGGLNKNQLLKQLKACIRSRIDVIAGESLMKSMDEVIRLYRSKHPVSKDRRFLSAIVRKVNEEEIDEKDPLMVKAKKMAESSGNGDKAEGSAQTLPETKDNKKEKTENPTLPVGKDEDFFELTDLHKQILSEEIVSMLKVLSEALEAKSNSEKTIVAEIEDYFFDYIAKFFKTTIMEKSQNRVPKGLAARLHFNPSEPQPWQLDKYLKCIRVVNAVRPHKKILYAQFATWKEYIRVINRGPIKVGNSDVVMRPWLTMKGNEYKKRNRCRFSGDLAALQIEYMEKKMNLYPENKNLPEEDAAEIGDESEKTKDAAGIGDDSEKTKDAAEIGDDSEKTKDAAEIGDDSEKTKDAAEVGDDSEKTKDAAEIGDESEKTKDGDAVIVEEEIQKEEQQKHTCDWVDGPCTCKEIFKKLKLENMYNSTENNEGAKFEMIGKEEMLVLDECKSDGCEDDDIDDLDGDDIQPDDLEDY